MHRIGLVVLLAMLAGCVSIGTKVDETTLTQFERGRTRYQDVLTVLGKPNTSTLNSDGSRQIAYVYTQSQMKPQNFIPIVAAFTQGASSETSTVTLDFDSSQVLVRFTATTGQTAVGTGFSSGARQ